MHILLPNYTYFCVFLPVFYYLIAVDTAKCSKKQSHYNLNVFMSRNVICRINQSVTFKVNFFRFLGLSKSEASLYTRILHKQPLCFFSDRIFASYINLMGQVSDIHVFLGIFVFQILIQNNPFNSVYDILEIFLV